MMALVNGLNNYMKLHPWGSGTVISTTKTSAADLIAQTVFEKKKEIDWTRNCVFGLFGFVYLGAWQYSLYNKIIPYFIPGNKPRDVILQVFIDQALHHPLMYFPTFYVLNEVIRGGTAADALADYGNEIIPSCLALWKIWVPAQVICFAFVPKHLRIPYVSAVSFVWTTVLSIMQEQFKASRPAKAVKAVN
eukprot:TRINITY_DN2030_c0_g1_i1.p1 TRINITY_DN2030_c0_g1~~TRINITY_DN2030_c0_g1_i1.p1  ORF type:complete len:191 (-),score=33.46 TRINITY_DN2030_c0_g1_i1:97-669(-)